MSRIHRGLATMAVGALSATALLAAPTAVHAADPGAAAVLGIRISEVISSGGSPGDWIEFHNPTDREVDLSGYIVQDESPKNPYAFPAGTIVPPGAYLVIDTADDAGQGDFEFGLGKGDSVRVFAPGGADGANPLLQTTWPADTHALPSWGVRDVDGVPVWSMTAESTKGGPNVFGAEPPPAAGAILINEVDSQPADWVEFHNPGEVALDVSGYEVRDNSDDHSWRFPPGAAIEPGGFLVVDEATLGLVGGSEAAFREAIGIGSADRIRLFDPAGTLIDGTRPWAGHAAIDGDFAAATLARCPDGIGALVLAHPTPGGSNSCVLPDVSINEIESNGDDTDWVEVINTGTAAVDMSGWSVMDGDPVGHAGETIPLAPGTILEPGALFVFDQPGDFVFGLGGGDTVTLRDADGATVDEYVYASHAGGVWARCPDGTGEFVDLAESTKGARNACGNPVRINEVESDGGSPDDWIELVNPTSEPLDVSGVVVKDDDEAHEYRIPDGTRIASGGRLVLERDQLGFGLGSADAVRLFDGERLIDETSWGPGHAASTWGRCPDTTGAFAVTAESTKGTTNACAGETAVSPWPGSQQVRALDTSPTFLEDSSGLDVQQTADGAFLWGIDNGEGRLWKLKASSDGSVEQLAGWEQGKRIRFQKDAGDPGAAGPDTEGVTVDDDGAVYVAAERDNSAKGVNRNVVLKVDPDAAAGDLIAEREWDLTALLPAVGANLGIEAVEWVPDDVLAGALFDQTRNAAYRPADHPGHGDGLFFVAVEDGGRVYAFALGSDGSATLIAEIAPGLAGVMGLDYDSVLDVLWAVCDDGCQGRSAQITLNGTAAPAIAHFARPAGMPDINNEGFATAPASLSQDGTRPVWWFADGLAAEALRVGTLPGANGGELPGGEQPGGEEPGADPDAEGPERPADVEPGAQDGALATTGSASPYAAAFAGLLLLALGALAVARRRRA
ncbi:lamin tail domain-containing protein [Microbacterium sp.]|uniref:lamin tail domain-containing protein n=1 Tax=Microbacterium sp. TaxID=51671 RepID=UPI002810CA4D|nr:lamin tail domain-containing protein [Microbacterium sp.]